MSELKGFAFEDGLNLCLPFDFLQRCQQYAFSAEAILALLRVLEELAGQDYLRSSQLDWLQDADAQALLASGVLLKFTPPAGDPVYLPGTPRGRSCLGQLEKGLVQIEDLGQAGQAPAQRPNLFKLYEDNIGPLTPMIADLLQEDAREFPAEWFEAAIREAVSNNARKWSYVRAILKNWKENGREKIDEKNRHGLEKYKEFYRSQKSNRADGRP